MSILELHTALSSKISAKLAPNKKPYAQTKVFNVLKPLLSDDEESIVFLGELEGNQNAQLILKYFTLVQNQYGEDIFTLIDEGSSFEIKLSKPLDENKLIGIINNSFDKKNNAWSKDAISAVDINISTENVQSTQANEEDVIEVTSQQVPEETVVVPPVEPKTTTNQLLTEADLEKAGFILFDENGQKQIGTQHLLRHETFLTEDEKAALRQKLIQIFADKIIFNINDTFSEKNTTDTNQYNLVVYQADIAKAIINAVNEVRGVGNGATQTPEPPLPTNPITAVSNDLEAFKTVARAFVHNPNQETYNKVEQVGFVMKKHTMENGKVVFIEGHFDGKVVEEALKKGHMPCQIAVQDGDRWVYSNSVKGIAIANSYVTSQKDAQGNITSYTEHFTGAGLYVEGIEKEATGTLKDNMIQSDAKIFEVLEIPQKRTFASAVRAGASGAAAVIR